MMFETVSVDNALSRGTRMVNVPVYFIMFAPTLITILTVILFPAVDDWFILIAFVAGFVLAWLYWSIMITRWRLWAFDNVRNVHELKKRAIKDKLIWPDGSFWAKTEIWSASDKTHWAALQYKFDKADVFNDDFTIAAETVILFSRGKSIGALTLGMVMIGAAIYFYLNERKLLMPCVVVAGGLYLLVTGFKNLLNRQPQLILSNDGMATAKTIFYKWDEIYNEETLIEGSGKSATAYLRYKCPAGKVEIEIAELDIAKRKLDSLLRLYRGRYEQKQKKLQA